MINHHHPFAQIIAWCSAQIFYIISLNVTYAYDMVFKTLSIISVSLIIIINAEKAFVTIKNVLKKLKRK